MRTELSPQFLASETGATAERVLRSCVHCGMCNATCPTYQLTGDELDGPRGRIYLIKQALEGAPVSRLSQMHLDRCLNCRACETTCPSGVEYHRLYEIGKQYLETRVGRPWRERWLRALLLNVVPYPGRLRFGLVLARLLKFALPARLQHKLPAVSQRNSRSKPVVRPMSRRMLLLTGCVQSVVARHFNETTRHVFARLGIELREESTGCCGALNFHLEDVAQARKLIRRNIDAWWPHIAAGAEAVIVNASGCSSFMREYAEVLKDDAEYSEKARRIAAMVRDPLEILSQGGLTATRAPQQPKIAVHDPCTLQNSLRLTGGVARLLRELGFDPQPVRDAHLCCGSAGSYSLLQPEMSNRLREQKLKALEERSPGAIYTANIGCWMHLAEEARIPVKHWLEAVAEVID